MARQLPIEFLGLCIFTSRGNGRLMRYSNDSDYVHDLVRLDHIKLEQLRQALIEGENSGSSNSLDIDALIADKNKFLI